MRVATVCIAFVVMNAGALAIYKSIASTPDAPRAASPTIDVQTLPQQPSQQEPVSGRPELTLSPDASLAPETVGEATKPAPEPDVAPEPTSRTSRSRGTKHVKPITRSSPPEATPSRPPPPPRAEPTPEPQNDKLLEMEANPYKRAE